MAEAQRLDGRACAAELDAKTAARAAALTEHGVQPHLAVVIVGDDPASHVYVRSKVKACERLGLISTHVERPATTPQDELEAIVDGLNADPSVHGILVQSPLPAHLDEGAITDRIDPAKDVDGFHPVNLGRLVQGRTDGLLPCTPSGVMEMLRWAKVPLQGKRAVVLGRSRIVGMPMALLWSFGRTRCIEGAGAADTSTRSPSTRTSRTTQRPAPAPKDARHAPVFVS